MSNYGLMIEHKEHAECYSECERLINTQQMKAGMVFDWPNKYQAAWGSGNLVVPLSSSIQQLLNSVNLNYDQPFGGDSIRIILL